MGLFRSLFSNPMPEYPKLDTDSWAGKRVSAVDPELHQLASRVSRPLEIVPSDHAVYVFIGKPPKKFGLAWIHDGNGRGFFRLVQEYGVTPAQVGRALDELRSAHAGHLDAEHYLATIGQRKVVVTVSEFLQTEVDRIINGMLD